MTPSSSESLESRFIRFFAQRFHRERALIEARGIVHAGRIPGAEISHDESQDRLLVRSCIGLDPCGSRAELSGALISSQVGLRCYEPCDQAADSEIRNAGSPQVVDRSAEGNEKRFEYERGTQSPRADEHQARRFESR